MIDKEKIKEFFTYIKENTFIAKSANDNLIASIVLSLIEKNLVEDIYLNIPNDLNQIFKTGDFLSSVELFKNKLIEIGIDEKIVSKLTLFDLYKLSKVLKVFIKTPSTVDFAKTIALLFSENISIAELYLDYEDGEFVFKPVYIHKANENSPDKLSYDLIYKSAPNYLIDKETLENEYKNANIVLPIKTNLIYIESGTFHEIDEINKIIISAFIKEFENTYIKLQLFEKNFLVNFKDVLKIYEYIIALANNIDEINKSNKEKIKYVYSSSTINISLKEIDALLKKYKNIKTKKDLEEFKETLNSYFDLSKDILQEKIYTFKNLEEELYSLYPKLVYFLNSLFSDVKEEKEKFNICIALTNDIINSLIFNSYLIPDKNYSKYIKIFVNEFFIAKKTLDKRNRPKTILFLEYFAPIHAEIIERIFDTITIKIFSKLNSIFIDENMLFLLTTLFLSFIYFREEILMLINSKSYERFNIFDIVKSIINTKKDDNLDISDKFKQLINSNQVDFKYIIDNFFTNLDKSLSERVNLFDIVNYFIYFKSNSKVKISDDFKNLINSNQVDFKYIIDNFFTNLDKSLSERLSIFDLIFFILLFTNKFLIKDKVFSNLETNNVSNFKIINKKSVKCKTLDEKRYLINDICLIYKNNKLIS